MRFTLAALLILAAASGVLVPRAAAQPAAAAASPARRAFEEGREHFEDRRYRLAAESFQRAHDLMREEGLPNAWMILYNLGTSLDEIPGREQDARDAYAGYLEEAERSESEPAARVALVRDRIRELELTIAANAPEPETSEEDDAPVAPPTPREPETAISPIGPIVMGSGGALLLASAITGIVLAVENESLLSSCEGGVCPTSARERAEGVQGIAIATDVLWIGGAAVAATGLVLTLLLRDEVGEEAPPVTAGCGPAGCSVQLRVEL